MKALKWLLIAFVVVVVLIAAVIGVVFVSIDAIAKRGVEEGATYALGVDTTLDSADVQIFGGAFSMAGLTVSNPEGFTAPHFLRLNDAGFSVDLASLQSDVVEIPRFALTDVDIHLQRANGASNFKTIMDNLKRLEGEKDPSPQPAGESKKFIIREVDIQNIVVHTDLVPIGGEATKVDIEIPSIELQNVGEKDGGLTMASVTKIIVQSIMATIARNGGGVIPADLLGDLQGQLAGLTSLSNLGIDMTGELGDLAGEAAKQAEKAVEDAANKAQEAVDEAKDKAKDALDGLRRGLPGGGGG